MPRTELDLAILAAAWLTGLAGGSGHCLGMCGGILAAIGTRQHRGLKGYGLVLCTHLGRVAGYGLAGAIAGTLGGGVAAGLFGVQALSLLRYAAALLIALIGLQLLIGRPTLRWLERIGGRVWLHLAPLLRHVLPPRTPAHALAAGLLWGWLPCGLVYAQLAVAAAAGGPVYGAATMVVFGLGTVISLSALSAVLHAAGLSKLPLRASGALLVLFALWTALPVAMNSGQHAAGH